MAPASMSQSGVKVRIRPTAPPSTRAKTMNSVDGSSMTRVPFRDCMSPVFIEMPPPPSSRQRPQHASLSLIVSQQHICRGPATIGRR